MCGIAGKINFDRENIVDAFELKRMTNSLRHRGPDDEGYFLDDNVGLGFRRLSIIDLKAGHQPLCDSSGKYWIIFNGEIYNFKELRSDLQKKGYQFKTNCDTEVIVNLYAEYKEKCVDYLRGMFAFTIWDKEKRELFGARDRFGIKPLYFYQDEKQFVWGSEIKAILSASNIKKEISIQGLDYYFSYGYSQRDQTVYTQIKKLLPGHYFILSPGKTNKMKTSSYWDVCYAPDYSKSEEYWKESIFETLEEAVKMRLMSDVPLGAFLSGGIDSSIVVALMAMNSEQPVKTFSIGFSEEAYNELQYAHQIVEKYSTDHHEIIVEPESLSLLPRLVGAFDEPFADSSAIPTYYVSKYAREHVTVALSGDGGDELFSGYDSYPKMLKIKKAFYNNSFSNNFIFNPLLRVMPDYLYGKGLLYYMSKEKENLETYYCLWKDYERRKIFNKDVYKHLEKNYSEKEKINVLNGKQIDSLTNMQYLDIKTYMVDDILTKVDIASMMNSLEVRVPLLDHKFAELTFRIPSELKLKNNNKKHILKETFKDILTPGILSHKKKGFAIPLKVWFKGDLKAYAEDTLLNDSVLKDYLNPGYIKEILENNNKGVRDYSEKIWSLLFFNEWMKQNI